MIPPSLRLTPSDRLTTTYDLITAALELPEEAIVSAGSSPGSMRARRHDVGEEIYHRYRYGGCPVIREWVAEQWFGTDNEWEQAILSPLLEWYGSERDIERRVSGPMGMGDPR